MPKNAKDTGPMRISPKYSVDDWKALTFSTEEDWQRAIDIFEDRIRGRFLKFINVIKDYKFSGFAVLALDCLLIETLQQFREGEPETPYKKENEYFVSFLTETSFSKFFDKNKAKKFYKQIRCGILHQAEVKKNSLVRKCKDEPLVRLTEDSKGLIVNRKLFHEQLVKVFEEYLCCLRDPSAKGQRDKLKKKMNYICRVPFGD
jgi:hypothetical protein